MGFPYPLLIISHDFCNVNTYLKKILDKIFKKTIDSIKSVCYNGNNV